MCVMNNADMRNIEILMNALPTSASMWCKLLPTLKIRNNFTARTNRSTLMRRTILVAYTTTALRFHVVNVEGHIFLWNTAAIDNNGAKTLHNYERILLRHAELCSRNNRLVHLFSGKRRYFNDSTQKLSFIKVNLW